MSLSTSPVGAYDPPDCSGGPFLDVTPSHPYCEWIQQFELDGITTPVGCGGGNYCPDGPVTRAQLAMHLERAMRGTADWYPWMGSYKRTLIVNPILDDGVPPAVDPTASGSRLMAVLNSIPNDDDSYLVIIEPGTYDVGSATLVQSTPSLAIQGAPGPKVFIEATLTGGSLITTTVGQNLWLGDVSLGALGTGAADLQAVHLTGGSVVLDHVTISASGAGDTYGLRVDAGSVTASGSRFFANSDGDLAAAVFANGGSVRIRNSSMTAQQGSETRAVLADGGAFFLHDVASLVTNGTANNRALAVEDGGVGFVYGGTARAFGTSSVALYVQDGDLTVDGGDFRGDTAGGRCVQISESPVLTVRLATLAGASALIGALNCQTRVSFTQLDNSVDVNGGTIECRGVTDPSFTFLPDTCP